MTERPPCPRRQIPRCHGNIQLEESALWEPKPSNVTVSVVCKQTRLTIHSRGVNVTLHYTWTSSIFRTSLNNKTPELLGSRDNSNPSPPQLLLSCRYFTGWSPLAVLPFYLPHPAPVVAAVHSWRCEVQTKPRRLSASTGIHSVRSCN